MKKCAWCACAAFAVSAMAFGEVQSFSKLARLTLTADADYAVATERDADFDIGAQPVFWLDCSQTNGWTFHETVAGRVMKVPNLVGGDRYLTGDRQEVQQENYWSWYTDNQGNPAHYGMWYSGWNSITGPTLRESDGVINGSYLDFGTPGSCKCLFFNPIVPAGETTETCVASNILRNVGTVVGVYKPWTDGSEGRGGQFFGGKDFHGHSGYSATTYGTNLFESVFSSKAKAAASGNTLWHNLQRNDAGTTYWTPKWEVVAFNPTAANLTADGVGCGDPSGVDYARTSGGQCVAELIVFDQVLSEEDLKKVIKHLMVKWLPEAADGIDGKARVSSVLLRNSGEGLTAGHAATFDVPEGEALTIDGVRGGAGTTAQKIVKTGAGPLTVNDAKNFGGEIDLEAGTLAFAARKVPTFDELPAGMSFNLDASDTSTLLVENGCVTNWSNLLKNSCKLSLYNNKVERRPRFIANALGEGMNVVDFGSRTDGDWAYLAWRVPPKLGTVLIVTDARIQGGGTPFDGNLQRGNSTYWWLGRYSSYKTKLLNGDDMRAIANVWMNGRWNDNTVDAYEVPSWQVAAFRAPPEASQPYYLGARYISSNNNEAGGLRVGEVIAYERTLDEREVRDVNAYLMKKWFGRIAPGYADASDVADLQTVVAAADAAIDVPVGETLRVGRLATTGAAVKTGEGTLVIGPDSDLTGGLTIGGGKVVTGASDVSETCEMAKEPYLHLDATDLNSMFTFVSGETTYVAAWQDRTGRAGAWSDNSGVSRLPFLNTEDGLNGLPVVDFGEQVNSYSTTAGRYLLTEPQIENARALYVIYAPNVSADGSAGGQIFGHQNAGGNVYDLSRGSSSPTLDQPFFKNCSEYIKAGEVYTNGERIASASVNTFKPTGGWQLVELHPTRGLRFDALATGSSFRYLYGGLRVGEVIVYERPLTAREKVATRNYLLKKWFPEQTREELEPKPAATAITGSISFGAGASWDIAVKPDGKTDDKMAVTVTVSFGTGATINLSGLTAFTAEQLQNLKLVIAKAGEYQGLGNVSVMGDVAFTAYTTPRLVARANGDLVLRFGQQGLMLLVR